MGRSGRSRRQLGIVPFVFVLRSSSPLVSSGPVRVVATSRPCLLAGLALLIVYAATKATYVERVFEPRIVERDLIYASPLLWAATALFLDRHHISLIGLAHLPRR